MEAPRQMALVALGMLAFVFVILLFVGFDWVSKGQALLGSLICLVGMIIVGVMPKEA